MFSPDTNVQTGPGSTILLQLLQGARETVDDLLFLVIFPYPEFQPDPNFQTGSGSTILLLLTSRRARNC